MLAAPTHTPRPLTSTAPPVAPPTQSSTPITSLQSPLPPTQSTSSVATPTQSLATPSQSQPTSSLNLQWTSTLVAPEIKDFTGSAVGPTVPIPDTPLDIFTLYYTPDIVNTIVEESNRYAKQTMSQEKWEKFVPLTADDIQAFMGLNILMGINDLPAIDDYWKKDSVYHYSPVADCISRGRYREISRYLHYVDNTTLAPRNTPTYDRLGKVRPLLDYIQSRFSQVYNPSRELAVDEAMIKFQGQSSLKQFMPNKPVKRGIKVWVLADSTNGYFSRLEVYTGKKGNTVEHNLGLRVVKDLTEPYQHMWHRVYFDNFFTSKTLICELEEVGIYGCGTARSDRKLFPGDLKKIKLATR